jgi:deltex-like protein
VKKQCPTCYQAYGPLTGDQPEGKMFAEVKRVIFGRGGYIDILVITYEFPDEIPKPFNYHCKLYKGTSVIAYLPNNEEGKKVLRLLRKAFDQKLTFTIGRSSPGIKDVVKLTDIPHKTSW